MFSSNIEFLSFPWIFSSTSLEIFDILLCLPVRCVKKKLKRSPQRFSLFHGHRLVVFMHLHWHSTNRHVSSGSMGRNDAKFKSMLSNTACFKSQELNINVLWWKHSWKIRYTKHVGSMREIDWGWLRMWGTLDIFSHRDPACCFGSPQYAIALDWTLNPAFL